MPTLTELANRTSHTSSRDGLETVDEDFDVLIVCSASVNASFELRRGAASLDCSSCLG